MKRQFLNLLYILMSLCWGLMLPSCSKYLDVDRSFQDRESLEKILNDHDKTLEWLANAYHKLLVTNIEIGHTKYAITNFADDMIFNEGDNGKVYREFKFGEYDYSWRQSWRQSYAGIRHASILIKEMPYNNDYWSDKEVDEIKAECRFLRAYYYWLLLRKYGPVPIIPDDGVMPYDAPYDELSIPRSSYEEVADYISDQMIMAAKDLPIVRNNRNVARATRGAALATRAKALLYAASPLANGNPDMSDFVDDKGRHLISQKYDEKKWARAAAAAKDVIELGVYRLYTANRTVKGNIAYPATVDPPYNPIYSENNFPEGWADIDPFESYRALFDGDLYATENPELIFTRGDNQIDAEHGVVALAKHSMPREAGGWNIHGLTFKQYKAYDMADGSPFDREKIIQHYGEDNMFTKEEYTSEFPHLSSNVWKAFGHREPRFYASVAFNGAVWPMTSVDHDQYRNLQVFYYRGSGEGRINSDRWIPTGIGRMKFVNPKDANIDGGHIYPKVDIAIRYADILLMYSECLNELTSSYDMPSWDSSKIYNLQRDQQEISKAISKVRIRAGVPDYGHDVYASRDKLRKKIKHERQVELMGENQRYYDLRRWKDAPKEVSQPIKGFNMLIGKEHRKLFYFPVKVPKLETSFSRKMYFWPVTKDELKRNKRLTQAPGWKTFD